MALADILLRTLSNPDLNQKGSSLTWVEEDTNFVIIYEALKGLTNFSSSGVAEYDGGEEYSLNDIVSFSGTLYTYINAAPSTGNAPPNATYWELTAGASLAHEQNKDQYLDFGGTNQVSAAEIRALLDAPIDLTTVWSKSGNTLTSRGTFGSSSGAFGWDFKVNGVVKGGVYNSGHSFFTNKLLQGYNDESLLSGNNVVFVADTDDGSTSALKLYASTLGTPLLNLLTNGNLRLSTGIYDSSGNVFFDIPNRAMYSSSGIAAVSANDFALYPNGSFSSLEWDLRIAKNSSNNETLDWENEELTGNWKAVGNFCIGSSASYGGGSVVMFIANAQTATSSDPTGGAITEVIDGTVWYRLPTGERVCVSGRQVTSTGDKTMNTGDTSLIYSGSGGGHTATLPTAVGCKETFVKVKNYGTHHLTVDGNSTQTIDGNLTDSIASGDSGTYVSDGANWYKV